MSNCTTSRRVVVTGIGMVTPVGLNKDESWNALLEGKSGIAKVENVNTEGFSVDIGGEVKNFIPGNYMDKRDARKYDRFVQFGMAAAKEAVEDSGIDFSKCDAERCGSIAGSGVGGILSAEDQIDRYNKKGPSRISPLTIPKIMVNCVPGMIAIEYGLKGLNYGMVTACASGSHSIGMGMRHIQWDEADVMVCGGAEAGISLLGIGGFSNMGALSTRLDEPTLASRPFDKNRDGFVIAEGAGIVVLEELEHAKRRGANIYAEILGCGFTDDAYHITAPAEGGEGAARAIKQALQTAGRNIEDVDYINAHGTSTPFNDKNEAAAIIMALGEDKGKKVKVNSSKSMTGHMLGAAGGFEFGVCCLSIRDQKIHGTINFETPDPECMGIDVTPNESIDAPVRTVLSNSLGFGGHNATLCVAKFEE